MPREKCKDCKGTGKLVTKGHRGIENRGPCQTCQGQGSVESK